MIISFLLWPIFFVLGLLFGIISPIIALCHACKQETKRWQTYVRYGSAVSEGHQKRIKLLAKCFLVLDCCQCHDEDHIRGKNILLGYYKLGHQIGFAIHIIVVTILKFALFVPFFISCSTSIDELRRADEAASLGKDLLQSKADGQRMRKSRNGPVRLQDVGSNEPDWNFQVEHIQPGALEPSAPPNPYPLQSESRQIEGLSNASTEHYQSGYEHRVSEKPPPPYRDEAAEPWGDWQAN